MVRMASLGRTRMAAAAVAAATLLLSGCAAGQVAQTAQQVAAIDGANGSAGNIGVRDVRLAPTAKNSYATGADVPIRLWLSNAALTTDSLTSVTSTAADKVVIKGSADLAAQTLVQVDDSSDLKITVTGLKQDVPYGHSIPMTFTFASGGTISVNAPIEIAGDRGTETRETVDVLPAEEGNIWFGGESAGESNGAAHEPPAGVEPTSDTTG